MNERIKELAVQAKVEHCVSHVRLQEFAELIVAECIEVFSKDMPDPLSPDYKLGTIDEVVKRMCNVAEHFGVEE